MRAVKIWRWSIVSLKPVLLCRYGLSLETSKKQQSILPSPVNWSETLTAYWYAMKPHLRPQPSDCWNSHRSCENNMNPFDFTTQFHMQVSLRRTKSFWHTPDVHLSILCCIGYPCQYKCTLPCLQGRYLSCLQIYLQHMSCNSDDRPSAGYKVAGRFICPLGMYSQGSRHGTWQVNTKDWLNTLHHRDWVSLHMKSSWGLHAVHLSH